MGAPKEGTMLEVFTFPKILRQGMQKANMSQPTPPPPPRGGPGAIVVPPSASPAATNPVGPSKPASKLLSSATM